MEEMKVYKRRDGFYIKHDNNWRVQINPELFDKYKTKNIEVVVKKHYGCKAILK